MSLLGTLFRPHTLLANSKIAACSAMIYEVPHSRRHSGRNHIRRTGYNGGDNAGLRSRSLPCGTSVKDVFIESLVAAGTCGRCTGSWQLLPGTKEEAMISLRQRRRHFCTQAQRRCFSSRPDQRQTTALAVAVDEPQELISRAEYNELVNTYDSPADLWEQPAHSKRAQDRAAAGSLAPKPPTSVEAEHFPLAPRLVLTPAQEDHPPYAPREILPPRDGEHAKKLYTLRRMLANRPGFLDLRRLWRFYYHLPGPRPRYLQDRIIRKLFRHLAWVEWRDLESLQRYFALVDECTAEKVPLIQDEWHTAMSYAGKWLHQRATTEEVKAAIETWMRMEDAGHQADNVTFNILFDVAIRAGRFALADTIYNEMQARDMPLNRYFRMSKIFYAGKKRNGDAVRQAFRELVNAGEIVDTSVMNCVIVSLVRSGEAASAENVFAKMKHLHGTKFVAKGPKDWREGKALGIELNRKAQELREQKNVHEASFFGGSYSTEDLKEQAQQTAPIHPNARTCEVLIKYHAHASGNLDRIRELLAEMKQGGMHINGSVYVHLLRGFWFHGGHAYTAWNRASLELFWNEICATLQEPGRALSPLDGSKDLPSAEDEDVEVEGLEPAFQEIPYISRQLAERAVYAFYKCAGRKKMLLIWQQFQERWKEVTADDKAFIEDIVQRLVQEDSRYMT